MMTRRKRPETAGTPTLFTADRPPKRSAERAVEAALTEYRADGRPIDPLMSKVLRSQGMAIDVAIGRGDDWKIGNANRVMLELMQGFGLVDRGEPDELDDLLRKLTAHDLDADQAGDADAAVRDEP